VNYVARAAVVAHGLSSVWMRWRPIGAKIMGGFLPGCVGVRMRWHSNVAGVDESMGCKRKAGCLPECIGRQVLGIMIGARLVVVIARLHVTC